MVEIVVAGIVAVVGGFTAISIAGIRLAERLAPKDDEDSIAHEPDEKEDEDAIPAHVTASFHRQRDVLQRQREDWLATIHKIPASNHSERLDYTKLVQEIDTKLLAIGHDEAAVVQRFVGFRERRRILERQRNDHVVQYNEEFEAGNHDQADELDHRIDAIDQALLALAKEETESA